jgi:hypothetical protein
MVRYKCRLVNICTNCVRGPIIIEGVDVTARTETRDLAVNITCLFIDHIIH